MNSKKLSILNLVLLSTGSVLGAGWLFSPYYGYQTAGIWVILSWIIAIILTGCIALTFAEVICILPVVGGVARFIGISNNRTLAFIFLSLGWLSYVVYLPVEVQSLIQYLGFFKPSLIKVAGDQYQLSSQGLILASIIILLLTLFNCLMLKKIVIANSIVSVWKIIVPIFVALVIICFYGKWHNFQLNYINIKFSLSNVLYAIINSGIAFAFTGFQNSLILANNSENPSKAMPYSLLSALIICGFIYILLSIAFIFGISSPKSLNTSIAAPLLGLVSLTGFHFLYSLLFIDAIIAPLGTANVFTSITARILYGLGKDYWPKSILTLVNKFQAPYVALFISGFLGLLFLLPMPTWKELVSFLSSIVVFVYLSGPISLLIFNKELPDVPRTFKLKLPILFGYLGFICCCLLIYWSGLNNLKFLLITIVSIIGFYIYVFKRNKIIETFLEAYDILLLSLTLLIISFLKDINYIKFPYDNLLIVFFSCIYCFIIYKNRLVSSEIQNNFELMKKEIQEEL